MKLFKTIFLVSILLLAFFPAHAQQEYRGAFFRYWKQLSVGVPSLPLTTLPPACAWLEVGPDSTSKGLLVPRALHVSSIIGPQRGLLAYIYDSSSLCFYSGSAWLKVGTGSVDLSLYYNKTYIDSLGSSLLTMIFNDSLRSDSALRTYVQDVRRQPGSVAVEKLVNGSWVSAFTDSVRPTPTLEEVTSAGNTYTRATGIKYINDSGSAITVTNGFDLGRARIHTDHVIPELEISANSASIPVDSSDTYLEYNQITSQKRRIRDRVPGAQYITEIPPPLVTPVTVSWPIDKTGSQTYAYMSSIHDSLNATMLSAGNNIIIAARVISADTATDPLKLATQGDVSRAVAAIPSPTLDYTTSLGNSTDTSIRMYGSGYANSTVGWYPDGPGSFPMIQIGKLFGNSWGFQTGLYYSLKNYVAVDTTGVIAPSVTLLNTTDSNMTVYLRNQTLLSNVGGITNGYLDFVAENPEDTVCTRAYARSLSGGGGGGGGTVTSVGLTMPSWLAVVGSPVTASGTLAVTATTGLTANSFLATPDGSTGPVGLRTIVIGDIPDLSSLYLTGNQSISFTASGDVGGTASGTTALSPPLTVNGLKGAALPALSTGLLKYNGSSWVFDNTSYSVISGLTAGYIPKAGSATTIVNGSLYDDGTNIGLGVSSSLGGKFHVRSDGIGTTPTTASGIYLQNSLAASSSAEVSPSTTWEGQAYNSTANASQPVAFRAYTVPINGGTLTGTWKLQSILNGGSATDVLTISSSGNLTVPGTLSGSNLSGINTGDQTSVTGNAGTATAFQTARTINGTSFDGTANITITAAAGTLTGTTLNSSVVTSSLTSVGTLTGGTWNATAIGTSYGGAPSGGTTGQVLTKNSNTNYDYTWATPSGGGGGSSAPQRDTFTANGTWTKPSGARLVKVWVIGGGGGGSSGRKGAAGSNRGGGGGGTGAGWSYSEFEADILGSTESVTVGSGGTGGTSVTANSTNGNAGNSGGSSTFGQWLKSTGGGGGTAPGTSGGAGGSQGVGSGRGSSNIGSGIGGSGGGTTGSSSSISGWLNFGGGGGGGINSANTAGAGGAANSSQSNFTNLTLPTTNGGANTGGNGDDGPLSYTLGIAYAGGGGGASLVGNAGRGGDANAKSYGAGGGGGGASVDSIGDSGRGGNGAPGVVIVVTYF